MNDISAKNVSRRKFLKAGTVGAGAAAGALAMPSVVTAQSPIVLKMQSSWPATHIFQEMAQQYVDRVNAMAGGRLKIDLLPSDAVVKAFQIQDAVQDAVLDAGHHVPAYWYGKNKAASLFGTGPVYGTDGSVFLAWFQYGGGKDMYNELVTDILGLNLVAFYHMAMPTQPLGWFKQPVTSADEINGLKYRTVGLAADVFQAMGASVTQLPGGEIIPAMERGVIDAFEFNNPTADRQFGAQDVGKHYMLGSYHQACETFEVVFNKDKFDSLDDDLKAILEFASEASSTANFGLAMERYSNDLQGLISEDGVTVHRTPQSIMEAQLQAWDQVVDSLAADAFFKKVIDSQKAFSERVGYYLHLNQADYKLAYEHYFPGKLGT
jgi:TRAP-type mannitol/chloroaromatic compound transport system substrate-binding protein